MRRAMLRHIFRIAAAVAITSGIGLGWYWGDPARSPKVDAVLTSIQIG